MSDILNKYGIENFYDAAIGQGFARDHQFRVLSMGTWITGESDLVYLTTTTLPGRTVNSVAVPYMGLNFQVPGTANYNQNAGWAVTFRCDESLNIRNLLENWNYGAFDDTSSKGANIPNRDAAHIMTLVSLDNAGSARKEISLIGAWCTNVGDVAYNLTGNGAVVTCNATIAYQYWRQKAATSPQTPQGPIKGRPENVAGSAGASMGQGVFI